MFSFDGNVAGIDGDDAGEDVDALDVGFEVDDEGAFCCGFGSVGGGVFFDEGLFGVVWWDAVFEEAAEFFFQLFPVDVFAAVFSEFFEDVVDVLG